MRLGRRDHLSLNSGPPGCNRRSPGLWGLHPTGAADPGAMPRGHTTRVQRAPRPAPIRRAARFVVPARGDRIPVVAVSFVGSPHALAPLRPRRMAAAASPPGTLTPRPLAAAAQRGRRLARDARCAADHPGAPPGHARRRAGRGVQRRVGCRPRRRRAHAHPSDDPPRRRRRPLARGRHGGWHPDAGRAIRRRRADVTAGGAAGACRRRGAGGGCGRRWVCTRRGRPRRQCAGGSAVPLYRPAERHLGGHAGGGAGSGHAHAHQRGRTRTASRGVALRGAGERRPGGLGTRGLLGGRRGRGDRPAVRATRGVNAPVLLLSGVTRRRRHRRDAAPVADVSLEVAAGEITALVGPHGSGKTTLLGNAPEAPVFPPTLSVREVLGYFARFHAAGTARRGLVAAALERAGLEGAAERRAAGLPLPVARRLALAQAALGHRRILLLDETLSGVDAVGRRAMCERVRDLAACGVAVLLASSDLVVVEQLAARVLVMRDGRVVRAAPTAALMGERVLEILLDAPPAAPPPGFRITPYGLQADLGTRSAEAAVALCRAHRLAVRASQVRGRTLEDAVLDALRDRPR